MHSTPIMRGALAAVALTSALALAACSGDAGGGDTGGDGQTIKIGFIGALTGGSASLNVPAVNGIQLAIDELNASGELDGNTLELVTADDEADATKSAQAATQMVTEEGVVAVIGGGNSGTVAANNPIITAAGVPQIISVAQVDGLIDPTNDGFPLTFRVTENNSYDVTAIAQLFEDGGYSHICGVADTTDYGQSGIETINAVFDDKGLQLQETVTHEVGATDMTAQVLTLKDAGCDAVYLFSLGADAATFMKSSLQNGLDATIIGGRGLNQAAFLSVAGTAGDGIVVPSTINPNKPETAAFIEAFDAEYGADVDPGHIFSALGYDTAYILVEGLKASGWKGGEDLAKALETVTYTGGASGNIGSSYSFTADKHSGPDENYLVFAQVQGGKLELYADDVASGN